MMRYYGVKAREENIKIDCSEDEDTNNTNIYVHSVNVIYEHWLSYLTCAMHLKAGISTSSLAFCTHSYWEKKCTHYQTANG